MRNAVFVGALGVEHRVTERRIRRQAVCLKDGFGGLRRDLSGLLERDFVAARRAQGCALVAPRVFGLIVGRPAKQVGTEFLRPRFRLGADRVIAIGLKPETPEKKYTNHPLVTYIAPAEPLGKLLEFDPDALRRSIALGYTDTLRVLGSHIGHTYTFEPDGQTLLEGVARDYLLWLLRRELTPPDSMLDFFRSDTPLTDRILGDQRSGLTDCALAGVECVLEAYTYPRGEIYDLKLLLPELAMRLAEDEDTPALERAHALCTSLGGEHFFTQLAPLTPRYDARDVFLATLTLYLREQTA